MGRGSDEDEQGGRQARRRLPRTPERVSALESWREFKLETVAALLAAGIDAKTSADWIAWRGLHSAFQHRSSESTKALSATQVGWKGLWRALGASWNDESRGAYAAVVNRLYELDHCTECAALPTRPAAHGKPRLCEQCLLRALPPEEVAACEGCGITCDASGLNENGYCKLCADFEWRRCACCDREEITIALDAYHCCEECVASGAAAEQACADTALP